MKVKGFDLKTDAYRLRVGEEQHQGHRDGDLQRVEGLLLRLIGHVEVGGISMCTNVPIENSWFIPARAQQEHAQ